MQVCLQIIIGKPDTPSTDDRQPVICLFSWNGPLIHRMISPGSGATIAAPRVHLRFVQGRKPWGRWDKECLYASVEQVSLPSSLCEKTAYHKPISTCNMVPYCTRKSTMNVVRIWSTMASHHYDTGHQKPMNPCIMTLHCRENRPWMWSEPIITIASHRYDTRGQ